MSAGAEPYISTVYEISTGDYLEGVGFRGIARLTGVSHVIVRKWVKQLGDNIERLRPNTGEIEPVNVMELDEMWHFIPKKKQRLGLASV